MLGEEVTVSSGSEPVWMLGEEVTVSSGSEPVWMLGEEVTISSGPDVNFMSSQQHKSAWFYLKTTYFGLGIDHHKT